MILDPYNYDEISLRHYCLGYRSFLSLYPVFFSRAKNLVHGETKTPHISAQGFRSSPLGREVQRGRSTKLSAFDVMTLMLSCRMIAKIPTRLAATVRAVFGSTDTGRMS